jgi:Uma2 family endonuclease
MRRERAPFSQTFVYNRIQAGGKTHPAKGGKAMSTIAPAKKTVVRQEHVYLPGVSYDTYEALVKEVGEQRNLRFTYYHGELEIMAPLLDHERPKKLLAQMIEAVTEELGILRMSCGSTTFKDKLKQCGLEPDECYYIQHEPEVRGRTPKLGVDAPPDLVLEVDVTTRVIKRLPIYAALHFPEIWQYVRGKIIIHLLQPDGRYTPAEQSLALPMVSVVKLVEHLKLSKETDETTWIRAFRQWVRSGMN